MPIDTNLALGVRPAQIPDPMQGYGRAVQLSSLLQQQDLQGMQMREAQRKLEGDRIAEEAYREALDPQTGAIDQTRLLSALAQRGQGSRIPGVQNALLETQAKQLGIRKTTAEIGAKEFETASKQVAGLNNMLGSLMARPDVTHDDVIQGVAGLVQQGLLTPQAGQQAIAQLPGNVQMLRPWLQQRAFETVEAGKRLELLSPRREKVDTGGQVVFPDMNPFTNPAGPGAIPKEMTPGDIQQARDAAASRAVMMRGQDLTAQTANTGVQYVQRTDGTYVALPNRAAPGQAVIPQPVMTMTGEPLRGKIQDAPEAFNKAIAGINELGTALNNYEAIINEAKGPQWLARGENRAKLQAAYTALQMGLKNAMELGALAGPDVEILGRFLQDPTSANAAIILGKDGVTAQISEARKYLKGREAAVTQTYGRANPATGAQQTAPQAGERKTVAGRTYVKVNGQWFEEGAR